ncbi:LuxR C-terminal-related transcriptional regulator [Actinomadura rudentiformis]|uniref:LuxR C-terminal-related transcriptional regulator n=1 Tax=Actinomadura rudentiformis TaxID=359158 RepID=UPI00384C31DA
MTESVYLALLKHPDAGVMATAERLGITEKAVRKALDRLTELSLLRRSAEEPGTLLPVSPVVGLNMLLARNQEDLTLRHRQIEQAKTVVEAISAEYDAMQEFDTGAVKKLDGIEAVRARLEELAHSAQDDCLSFVAGPQQEDALEASRPLDRLALERGVRIRIVYQESFRNHPVTLRYVRWLTMLGGEARTVPTLPLPLVIVDREVALVPLDAADVRLGALEVRSGGLVGALCSLFEYIWISSIPFGDELVKDDIGLAPQERAILRLLANGQTDDSVARELGLSVRTVRRQVSSLMTKLGARSRFQAGVLAAERDWL